ncbi:MAG: iron donor protein CyaY [Myxococcales bacterium FL481]|nr:MAG: iron donor protein CyaY [Myxococcales bacterium FL481]
MDRSEFAQLAHAALNRIDRGLGDLEHEQLDCDLAGDVLTLSFDDGVKFIVNAHSAAGQIWLAAGSHAWHFDYRAGEGRWIASKNGDELLSTIARVVGDKLELQLEL